MDYEYKDIWNTGRKITATAVTGLFLAGVIIHPLDEMKHVEQAQHETTIYKVSNYANVGSGEVWMDSNKTSSR